MRFTIHVWRQKDARAPGGFARYEARDVTPEMSLLEVLDGINEELSVNGEEPIAFDHDCREGICGTCGFMINGIAHGPARTTTTCQLHMRHFNDGAVLRLEPWRARAFPVVRDLVVDRSSFDRLVSAGGFISAATGNAPDANAILIPKATVERAMDAASCIGCGACVAACPNASASLFIGAKIVHLGELPQGAPERDRRVLSMLDAATEAGFGHCANVGDCEVVCPKGIGIDVIGRMNRDFIRASLAALADR